MKLIQLLRLAAETKVLKFNQPSAKTLQFLRAVNTPYESETGGFTLLVNGPTQKNGAALIYKLVKPGRYSWVSVHRVKGEWQIDAFG
jgi:hypothetical protein